MRVDVVKSSRRTDFDVWVVRGTRITAEICRCANRDGYYITNVQCPIEFSEPKDVRLTLEQAITWCADLEVVILTKIWNSVIHQVIPIHEKE